MILGCRTRATVNIMPGSSCPGAPQEVKAKTAAMDADLASKQSALEAHEQARDMAADKLGAMEERVASLGGCPASALSSPVLCCMPRQQNAMSNPPSCFC